jgi:ABC-type phosphate/phosphonate transport system substrate-binding protein
VKRLLLAAILAAVPAAAAAAPLRIAVAGEAAAPCAPAASASNAGERAYSALLEKRLEVAVERCPFADRSSAAAALAGGQVDLAVLDPAAYGSVAGQVRSILTVRAKGSLNRIPVIVGVPNASPRRDLAALKGARVAFAGPARAGYDVPRRALADQGADPTFFVQELRLADAEDVVARLRAGEADAMVLHATAWQRVCRGDSPGENKCKDITQIWRGRPRAAMAIAVRRDIPLQLRYRLVGVHVAMHLEAPGAFAWASAFVPGGEEFEPTEADALALTQAVR